MSRLRASTACIFVLCLCSTLSAVPAESADFAHLAARDVYREIGMIPMRDSVELAYILYLPDRYGRFPTLFIYNPYWGGGQDLTVRILDYVRHGYAVLSVSIRATGRSGGSPPVSGLQEGVDGADVVEWAGRQTWCDGNVGMFGQSYAGRVQYQVAAQQPPHLRALAPAAAGTDLECTPYPGGVENLAYRAWWALSAQPRLADSGLRLRKELGDPIAEQLLDHPEPAGTKSAQSPPLPPPTTRQALPPYTVTGERTQAETAVSESPAGADPAAAAVAGVWQLALAAADGVRLPCTMTLSLDDGVLRGRLRNESYGEFPLLDPRLSGGLLTFRIDASGVGGVLLEGSLEITGDDVRGSVVVAPGSFIERGFQGEAERIEIPALLIHGFQDEQVAVRGGIMWFEALPGPKKLILVNGNHEISHLDILRAERIRWFDRWLKGEPNGIDEEPPVSIMFETLIDVNRALPNWVWHFSGWPIPQTQWRPMFLTADGRLDSAPADHEPAAGTRAYLFPIGTELVHSNAMFSQAPSPVGSLLYRTEPMDDDLAIIGAPVVRLFTSCERQDTDFMVVLHDVDPDGNVTYLQRGFLRASRRKLDPQLSTPHQPALALDEAQELTPGTVYEMTIALFPMAHVVRRGHRLELGVMSPPTMPHPYWGFNLVPYPGINTVYHSTEYPSRIELPIIPGLHAPSPPPPCGALLLQPCRRADGLIPPSLSTSPDGSLPVPRDGG